MESMVYRIAVARILPDELQSTIWTMYNSQYVLPDLMKTVETRVQNAKYEYVYDRYSEAVARFVGRICGMRSVDERWFNHCMEVAEDRICESCETPMEMVVYCMFQVVRDNITHPYLMRLGLLDQPRELQRYYHNKCDCIWQSRKTLITLTRMIG